MATNPRIDDLRKRLEKEPQSRLFAQLAEELRKDGELDEAIRVCRDGLQKHPNYPSARMTMGRALLDTGDAAAARSEFETVLKAAPDNILASRYLGEALEGMGDTAGAKQRYRLTLAMAPGDKHVTQRLQALEAGPAPAAPAPVAAPAVAARPAAPTAAPASVVPPRVELVPPVEEPEPPPIKLAEADESFELERPWEAPTVAPVSADTPTRAYGVMRDVAPAPSAAPAPPAPAAPAFGGGAVEYEFEPEGTLPFTPAPTVQAVRPDIPEAAPEPMPEPPPVVPEPPPAAPEMAAEVESPEEDAPTGPPAQFAELDEMEWEAPSPGGPAPTEPVIQTRFDMEKEAAALHAEVATSPASAPAAAAARPAGGELATPTLAELYFNQGFTDRAVEVYREVLGREPGNTRAQARLAELEALAAHLRAAEGGPGPEGRREVIQRTIQRLEALMHAMKEVGR